MRARRRNGNGTVTFSSLARVAQRISVSGRRARPAARADRVHPGIYGSVSRLLIATLALAFSLSAWAEITGKVVAVTDGDTITVLDASKTQHKVRLAGIDAPEKGQPGGFRSKESLSQLVYEHQVRVEGDKQDRYGRLVGKVWVAPQSCPSCGMTLDAGLAQITMGRAWWFRRYAKEQSPEDRGRYEFAEQEARAKKVGLWRDPDPVPPWEWRKGQRQN